MNERRYLMLRELLEIKHKEALEQEAECEQIIKETLDNIVSMENADCSNIDEYGSDGWRVECVIKDSEGKNAWGCGCTIYYKPQTDYRDKRLEMNYGTSGSFDKSDTDYIDRTKMLYKLSQAFEEIEQMFDNLKRDKIDDYWKTYYEVDSAKQDLKRDYAEQIESGLAVGKEYKNKYDDTLKIEKITPKFVHYTENDRNYWTKERKSEFLDKQARLKFEEFEAQYKEQKEDVE